MENSKINLRFGIIALMIVVAALSRLLPHPSNFTPITGMALFGAAYFTKKYWAFIIPFLAMWLSDLFLNNVVYANMYPQYYEGWLWFTPQGYWIYGGFALIIVLGMLALKKVKPTHLVLATLGASILFFSVTNFGVWLQSGMYPKTGAGLMSCFAAGIPFLRNAVLGDLFYSTVMFGSFELISRYYLTPAKVHA